jgi:F0F1-type ATP synthase membrane subunit b/b'
MKDIVDKILKEEEQTRKRLAEAERQAEVIIEQAKKESQNIIEEVIKETKAAAEKKRAESEKASLSDKENVLNEAKEKIAALRKGRERDIDGIAAKVFLKMIEMKD